MARFGRMLVAALGALGLIAAGSATALAHDGGRGDLIEFHSMFGVHGALVGTVNHRGITGGGLPWKIASARGEVERNGEVTANVKGLVIPVAPFNGTNPVPMFGAIVSCISTHHHVVNVSTGLFPASAAGDSMIKDKVTLPSVCDKPIVFITSPGGSWFARTHLRDAEGDDD
jgi:hypothetical protein